MPMAEVFNDVVSADMKCWKNVYFLVMVDMSTRYCAAVVVPNKLAITIITAFFTRWISVFGAPRQFLSDNGGEFSNAQMRCLADRFGIKLLNTAAESPWSNGLCERLNGILATSVTKIMDDTSCNVDIALSWAVAARNTLQNFSGFSPNQLVFGKNPAIPNVLECYPPQLEDKTNSKVVADNLNAMHAARRDFIRNESDERIRRALLRQTREDNSRKFQMGDNVYYKRNDSDQWHGPARVIGRDGKQVLVRHGGIVIRVHACRLQHDVGPGPILNDELHENIHVPDGKVDSEARAVELENDDSEPVNSSSPAEIIDSVLDGNSVEMDNAGASVNNDATDISSSCVQLRANKLKVGQRIEYVDENGDKCKAQVTSRAGKASGKYDSSYNIRDVEGNMLWIDLKGTQWEGIPDENEVLVTHGSDELYKAKQKEVKSWVENEVFDEIEDIGQSCISVRWVITEKVRDGATVTKARLVARGFEEQLAERTDSPTCTKDCLRIALSLTSSKGWKCNTIDIKSAFLQGNKIQREIFVRPPTEFSNGKIWKLKKSVYGLNDAARAWYQKMKDILLKFNMKISSIDPAFFYFHENDELSGLMCMHVDDIYYAGTKSFIENVIDPMMKVVTVGTSNSSSFKYIGVNLDQNDGIIRLDQSDYVATLEPMKISKQRCNRRSDYLGNLELENYRALTGQLNWLATQTRPDVSYSVNQLSKSNNNAIVDDVIRANKVVNIVKQKPVHIAYLSLDLSKFNGQGIPGRLFGGLE